MKSYAIVFALLLASTSVCEAQARKWTDDTGKHSVEAELVEVKGDTVVLKKPAGSVISLPIARLSQADQEYLQLLGKPAQESPDDGPAVGELSAADQEYLQQKAEKPPAPQEEPQEPADAGRTSASTPGWTTDLNKMNIPDRTASGKIGGYDFVLDAAELENGILTLRQGRDFFPDLALMIFLFLNEGESVEGKKFTITPESEFGSPHIHVKWREKKGEGTPETDIVMDGYAMILEFGKYEAGKIPGRIYACLSDKSRSVVMGTFTAVMPDQAANSQAGEINGEVAFPSGFEGPDFDFDGFETGMDGGPEESSAGGTLAGLLVLLVALASFVLIVAAYWKVFAKAGLPGWGVLVPIYNVILWLRVAGRPGWWFFLFLVPLVNVIIAVVVHYGVATKFGKGIGYALGLIFLPMIFYPMLGFSSARYRPAPARRGQQAAVA